MLLCFCCNKFYNLQERKPVQLPCGDIFCLQCYKNQKDQVQNQQIQCPFDAQHLCGVDQQTIQPRYLMNALQKYDFFCIKCDDHQQENSTIYCKQQQQMVCGKCVLTDPHEHFVKDSSQHFTFERIYIEESFEKTLPILKEEMTQIQSLIEKTQQFLNKERNFKVQEIKQSYKQIIANHENIDQINQIQIQNSLKFNEFNAGLGQIQLQNVPEIKVQNEIGQNKFQQVKKLNKLINQQVEELKHNEQSQENIKNQSLNEKVIKEEQKNMIKQQNQPLQAEKQNKQRKFDQNQQNHIVFKIPEKIFKYEEFTTLVEEQLYHLTKKTNFPVFNNEIMNSKQYVKLLYKASRDGYKAANFHTFCDNKGPTMTFILNEHGQVFGGYTSVSWQSTSQWCNYTDKDAFLFQLNKNTIHFQYQQYEHAVVHYKDRLMVFGEGRDICIYDDCNINCDSYCDLGGTYSPPQGIIKNQQQAQTYLAHTHKFRVIEIEVYSIIL
ncbi:tldc domain-containing protein [Stylonychia lemnae]|uniref:Tldc domain-containing protein n=1 Tax=Stylonychia lemnae TaxID=5949 RepID=A0A078B7X6_STYLE|nr:tldc domain-containing protein [Stylonychia lemnae]|eukprot:CDW89372.1 tldc domain-containing protein [Stylonychia lemnae]